MHVPVHAGTTNPRRDRKLLAPLVRETSTASIGGQTSSGNFSVIMMPIAGWMTVERGVRSGSAKPEAKVERTETAAMRVNFMVGRR